MYNSYTRGTKRCSCSLHDPTLIVEPRRHGWWSGGCFGCWIALTSTCPGFHFQCLDKGRCGENKNPWIFGSEESPLHFPGWIPRVAEYFGGILPLLGNQKGWVHSNWKRFESVWGSVQFLVPRGCTLDSKSNVKIVQLLANCGITMLHVARKLYEYFGMCVKDKHMCYVHIIYILHWLTQKGLTTWNTSVCDSLPLESVVLTILP